jgi:hypothetical protein
MPALNSSALVFQLMQAAQQRQQQELAQTRDTGMYLNQQAQEELAQREALAKTAQAEAAALTQARALTGEEAPVYSTPNEQAGSEMGRLRAALALRENQAQRDKLAQEAAYEQALEQIRQGGQTGRTQLTRKSAEEVAEENRRSRETNARVIAGSRARTTETLSARDALTAYQRAIDTATAAIKDASVRTGGATQAERAEKRRTALIAYEHAQALGQTYRLPPNAELEQLVQELQASSGGATIAPGGVPRPPGGATLTPEGAELQRRSESRRNVLKDLNLLK